MLRAEPAFRPARATHPARTAADAAGCYVRVVEDGAREDDDTGTEVATLGLALAGGAARGVAHLGVLRALRDRGVQPDVLSGTSAGALIGALWAAGWRDEHIREAVHGFAPFQPWRYTYTRPGLFDFRYVRHYWSRYLPERFEDLDRPLTVVVTEVATGEPRYLDSGPLEPAVLASCALPPLFESVEIDGRRYFDGGLVENLPSTPLRNRCTFLVGSEVNPDREAKLDCCDSTWGLFSRGMEVVFRAASDNSRGLCDAIIEPEGLEAIHPLDTSRLVEIEALGYDDALRALDAHGSRFAPFVGRAGPPSTAPRIPTRPEPTELYAPVFPDLPLPRAVREHPEHAFALILGAAAATGVAWWWQRRSPASPLTRRRRPRRRRRAR